MIPVEGSVKKIVLISCVSKKLSHPASAQDLYISPLFRLNLQYARRLKPGAIYILSAKHGLLDLDTEVEPYDLTLNDMAIRQVQAWADQVLGQIKQRADLSGTTLCSWRARNTGNSLCRGLPPTRYQCKA